LVISPSPRLIDGDGYLDLAGGVPGENSGAGGISVLDGFASGLTAGNSLSSQ
jgi:hypothetical protein